MCFGCITIAWNFFHIKGWWPGAKEEKEKIIDINAVHGLGYTQKPWISPKGRTIFNLVKPFMDGGKSLYFVQLMLHIHINISRSIHIVFHSTQSNNCKHYSFYLLGLDEPWKAIRIIECLFIPFEWSMTFVPCSTLSSSHYCLKGNPLLR